MLRIKSLSLENWKNFPSRTFEFHAGFNLLFGPNFAGKTSIIEALNYAFTGNLGLEGTLKKPEVAALRKAVINNDAGKATVVVDFDIVGDDGIIRSYRISRTLTGANETSYLYEIVDGREQETTGDITGVLGVSQESLYRFLFFREGEIFEAAFKPAENFQQFLESNFNLSTYRDLQGLIKQLKASFETERKNLTNVAKTLIKSGVPENPDAIPGRIAFLDAELEKLYSDVDAIENEVKTKGAEISAKNKVINENKGSAKTRENFLRQQESLKTEIGKLEASIKKILIKYSKPAEEFEAFGKGESDILDQQKKQLQEEFDKKSERLAVLTHEIQRLHTLYNNVGALGGTCPTCQQDVSEEHKQKILIDLNFDLEANQNESSALLAEKNALTTQITDATQRFNALIKDHTAFIQQASLLNTKNETMEQCVADLAEMGDSSAGVESIALEEEIAALESECEDLDKKKEKVDEVILDHEREKATLEKMVKFAEKIKLQQEKDATLFQWTKNLDALTVALEKTIEVFRDQKLNNLKRVVEQYWKDFRGENALIEWDSKGQPVIDFQGHKRPYLVFSESERYAISLAIKVSIISSPLALRAFVFDEPFHHFGTPNLPYIAAILQGLQAEQPPWQIICTSFNEQVKQIIPWDKIITI